MCVYNNYIIIVAGNISYIEASSIVSREEKNSHHWIILVTAENRYIQCNRNRVFRGETQITTRFTKHFTKAQYSNAYTTLPNHHINQTQPVHNAIIIISNPLNRRNRNNKQTDISRDTQILPGPPRTSKETDSTPRPYRPKITDRAKDIYGHRYLKLLWLGKFKPILGATGALRLAIQAARCIHTNATVCIDACPSTNTVCVRVRMHAFVCACIHACARRVTRGVVSRFA